MDTILASIRRILNEDEVAPAEAAPDRREPTPAAAPVAPPPQVHAPAGEPDSDDVLVLGKAMMVPPEKIEPPPVTAVAVPQIPEPPPAVTRAAVPEPPPGEAREQAAVEGLVAARTRAAMTQSFDALHEAMRRDQMPPPPTPTSPKLLRSGGPTLEDLVRDELRGLIGNWLDEHLPGLVETLVRSEIEKLTRRTG